jgi:MFS transporter, UMF1 family
MNDSSYDRKAVFGWAFYDWANSAYATVVMAAFFPIFFKQFWCGDIDTVISTARLGMANSISGIVVAVFAPVMGAMADRGGAKKKFLLFFLLLGTVSTSALYFVARGEWLYAVLLYIISIIGFSGGNIFYDSLLPDVSTEQKMDYVSSLGFSLGYLGGGLLFAVNIWMTLRPLDFGFSGIEEAVRFSFLSVGLWWLVFAIPLFVFVKEPGLSGKKSFASIITEGFKQFAGTFREIRRLKHTFLFLLAYWLYIDGVDTIIRMAIDYGLSIGLKSTDLVIALLVTQFVAFPAALLFGYLGGRIGTKRAIFIAIAVYLIITIWGAFMKDKYDFYMLAIAVGLVQGGIQALSRSFFARIIPRDKTAEYFGFYNMVGKLSIVLGPVLISAVALTAKAAGFDSQTASRISISAVSLLFLAGGVLFYLVDEGKARAAIDKE